MIFSEVSVGQKFKMNNIVYEKIEQLKVSCCRSINAKRTDNNETLMVQPNSEVEIVTE